MIPPPRFNVHGVGVHALTLPLAQALIVQAARAGGGARYVCCCDAHSVSWAHRRSSHRRALQQAYLVTPDGMPLVWLGRRTGHAVQRVYGPDLMLAVCAATAGSTYSHFFYGAHPGTAPILARTLQHRFPGLTVAGTLAPPDGTLHPADHAELARRLEHSRPDFLWIGLSTPKQEAFMLEQVARLPVGVMLGVGAAFDLLSGRVRQAPPWLRRSGGEWLWRLVQEPRRLTPRYVRVAPAFVWRTLAQLSGLRRYSLEGPKDGLMPPQNRLP